MLFLFNDALYDLGDVAETARERGDALGVNPLALRNLRVGQVIKMVREWVWERPALAKSDPQSGMFLAALVAMKTNEANALLAVAPNGSKTSADVQVRLASVSLVTMKQLLDLQAEGRLSGHMANMAVWSQAPARMQA
ncbi:hypothetical protein ACFELO_09530 [Oceanicaulis sp. LC35]|uniref:hypothetical protein n=1 Tax=Oceanicaulis sp. LC35 TaxID=3349635 RepID=UPI003F84A13A